MARLLPLAAVLLLALLLAACSRRTGGDEFLRRLSEMDESATAGGQRSREKIRELKGSIARYRKEVNRKVEATGQLGVYYKMLALEYMREKMYQAAYESLQEAIAIYPENPILFYYSAVCAARLSKAQVEQGARERWLGSSERLYLRALTLDPRYADALYGLSVLYIFELDRPQEAEGLLKRLLSIEKRNVDARFLLARVYYRSGRLENALQLYKDIAALTTVKDKREQALVNAKRIEEELYGAQ